MIFSTNRLIIRKIKETDFDEMHEMHRNPKVMRYTGSPPHSLEADRANMTRILNGYEDPANDFWIWAVTRKKDNVFLGTCALIKSESNEDEIGYRFLEKHWGQGYATEITPALINHAFTKFEKTEIIAEVDELNSASVKILEKYMTFVSAYYSEKYQSNDRKYIIKKSV